MTPPLWRSRLEELVRLVRLGERFAVSDLGRIAGARIAGTEINTWRALRRLREVGKPLGVELVVKDGLIACRGPGVESVFLGEEDPAKPRTRRTVYRAALRAIGLCMDCKAPAVASGLCERHNDKKNRRHRALKRRRKEARLCLWCPSRAAPGIQLCHGCKESHSLTSRVRYRAKRARGLCICGEPSRPGRVFCTRCKRRRTRAEKVRARTRREAGLCTKCGREPAAGGVALGATCRERRREVDNASYRRKRAC